MKKLTIVFAFLFVGVVLAQEELSYFPIVIGKEKKMRWYDIEYVETYSETQLISGKKYYI